VHLDRLDGGRPELTVRGSMRFEMSGIALSLEPGMDGLPVTETVSDWADHLTMKVAFSSHIGMGPVIPGESPAGGP
jgi:hypothetical protein